MAQFELNFVQDLMQKIGIRHCETMVFTKDNLADAIRVALYVGEEPYSGGGTVSATAVRSDGITVPITNGSITGNVVTVYLTEAAVDVPGNVGLYVKLTSGDTRTTVLAAIFAAQRTETDSTIDPGTIIPSVTDLINAIDAAVDSIPPDFASLLAGIAPVFSALTNYEAGAFVWNEGVLYRFTTAHPAGSWTGTDVVTASMGADFAGEIEDFKNSIVLQQSAQPTEPDNRIWFPSATPEGVEVPTFEEFSHIAPDKCDFATQGKNLFIPYTLKKGIIISTTTHKETENANYYTSDYIPVTGGTAYIIRYMSYIHYYDTGKNWVSLDSNTYQNNYTFTPAQDGYIRFSNNIQSASNLNNTLNNIIAKSDEYYVGMPYEYEFDEHYVGLDDDIHPINLISSIENGYVRRTDGAVASPNGQYRSSNLIKIAPDKSYYWYNLRPDFGGFYNKFGQYIATSGSLANPFKPSDYVTGAVFVRVSGYNNQIGLYERPISKFVQYGEKVFDESLVNLNAPVKLDVFLPPDFYVNIGRTIEIFNESLLSTPTADGFSFRWVSTTGTNYGRKFVFTSNTVGDYAVNLRIYDKWFNIVFDGNTTIHVVNALSSAKTIVPIGDSLTNGKPWLGYIAELQNSGITFTGTRWHDTGTSIAATIKHEGRSGWRASQYTANTTYTFDSDGVSSANPFYDTENSTFSWTYYKTQYNISADGVQFLLGTNGLNLAPQAEENALVNMVNKIRSEDANIPIFVCYPIHAADQNGCARQANSDGYSAAQGMFYAEKKLAMWNYIKRLYTRLKDASGVYLVPVCQNFDHEYMFGITDVPVNQYSEITEPMPTEGIHPRDYHQFIDPMYGAYCYAFGT